MPSLLAASTDISWTSAAGGDGAVRINLHSCDAAGTSPRDRSGRLMQRH
jgi:hypothetical protein